MCMLNQYVVPVGTDCTKLLFDQTNFYGLKNYFD